MSKADVQSALRRIENYITVEAVVVADNNGVPVYNESGSAIGNAKNTKKLCEFVQLVSSSTRVLDPDDELLFIRLQTAKNELILGRDDGFVVIVAQNDAAFEGNGGAVDPYEFVLDMHSPMEKVELTPADELAKRFHSTHFLSSADKILRTFHDPPPTREFVAMANIGRERRRASDREIIVVDLDTDTSLQKFVTETQAVLAVKSTMQERASELATLVANRFGGRMTKALQEDSENRILQMKKLSPLVPLGRIEVGTCRHRALAFKVIGDRVGLSVSLSRSGDGVNVWNTVEFESAESMIVDLLQRPGALYGTTSEEGVSYQHACGTSAE